MRGRPSGPNIRAISWSVEADPTCQGDQSQLVQDAGIE